MTLFKDRYRIESSRLPWWDYKGDGGYFIAICTKNREEYFGEIKNGIIGLNEMGMAAYKYWSMIPDYFDNVVLDDFVIMPNHIPGILMLKTLLSNQHFPKGGITGRHNPMGKGVLGEIIRWFKGRTIKEEPPMKSAKIPIPFFIGNPYDHDRIIRDETELYFKQRCVRENPMKWTEDRNHSDNFKTSQNNPISS